MNPPLHIESNRSANELDRARQSLVGVRLRKHSDYVRAYAVARKHHSASMSWFLAPQPQPDGNPRVGLTAVKALGKAHERNKVKRRLREVVRRNRNLLPHGCDLILHPRRAVLTMEFTKLSAEVLRILRQASAEADQVRKSVPPKPTA